MVGHGLVHGVGHGLPYGASYGLLVVNFVKTWLSVAANLCKQRAHQSVISTTLFRPLGGVSLKFSQQTLGRLESGKPECRINTTFGERSDERGIVIKHLSRISAR